MRAIIVVTLHRVHGALATNALLLLIAAALTGDVGRCMNMRVIDCVRVGEGDGMEATRTRIVRSFARTSGRIKARTRACTTTTTTTNKYKGRRQTDLCRKFCFAKVPTSAARDRVPRVYIRDVRSREKRTPVENGSRAGSVIRTYAYNDD